MNATLIRTDFQSEGIFGILTMASGVQFHTLEHAFPNLSGDGRAAFLPAIPLSGTFQCLRGLHQLEGMSSRFIAFELQNVPNHSGILIHVGNCNDDSSGCILIGQSRHGNLIMNSRQAFSDFMELQVRTTQFSLEIM